MSLTEQQKTEFLAALGIWNGGASLNDTLEAQASAGEYIADHDCIVSTHETLAEFTANRGRPQEKKNVGRGKTLYVWRNVQFQKGKPRRTLFLLEFDGISACMIR